MLCVNRAYCRRKVLRPPFTKWLWVLLHIATRVLRCVNIDSFLVATVGILVTILKMVVSREYCHDLTMSERASFAGFDPWLLHPRAGSPCRWRTDLVWPYRQSSLVVGHRKSRREKQKREWMRSGAKRGEKRRMWWRIGKSLIWWAWALGIYLWNF